MADQRISILSPAKINLSLRITGRRGRLHTISSVMTLLDFADLVSVSLRDDGQVRRRWSHKQVSDDADLTMRAAMLFKSESKSSLGADVTVDKQVPVGGGLGGGSSNAAATLLALNQLWNVNWRRSKLIALARKLGSDVPFFIEGKPSRATGVGDLLRTVKLPSQYYLLLLPAAASSTVAVYAEYARFTKLAAKDKDSQAAIEYAESLIDNKNDLVAAAFSVCPKIITAAQQLRQATGQALLSGSGSCVYAVFPNAAAAKRAQKKLPTECRSVVATPLTKHPFYTKSRS